MSKRDVGVIIARFQVPELHAGHISLVEGVAARHERVVIFLGVGRIPGTKKNPLSYEARVQMASPHCGRAIFYPLPDMPSDLAWSQNVDNVLRTLFPLDKCILYGGPESFIPHYHGKHETVKINPIAENEGTAIREAAGVTTIDDDHWRAGVIHSTQNRFPAVHSVVDIAVLRHATNCSAEQPCGMEVLMGRKAVEADGEPDGVRFIGGFVDEKDYSQADAARREMREEAGAIETGSMTYVSSHRINDWRYRDTGEGIMSALFYTVMVFGNPVASDDISTLGWVPLPELEKRVLDLHLPFAVDLVAHVKRPNGDIFHQFAPKVIEATTLLPPCVFHPLQAQPCAMCAREDGRLAREACQHCGHIEPHTRSTAGGGEYDPYDGCTHDRCNCGFDSRPYPLPREVKHLLGCHALIGKPAGGCECSLTMRTVSWTEGEVSDAR